MVPGPRNACRPSGVQRRRTRRKRSDGHTRHLPRQHPVTARAIGPVTQLIVRHRAHRRRPAPGAWRCPIFTASDGVIWGRRAPKRVKRWRWFLSTMMSAALCCPVTPCAWGAAMLSLPTTQPRRCRRSDGLRPTEGDEQRTFHRQDRLGALTERRRWQRTSLRASSICGSACTIEHLKG